MKEVISEKTGKLVLKINEKQETITYYVHPESSQFKYFNKIIIKGFVKQPSGFYKDGYGLTALGQYLLREIADVVGDKFNLIFTKSGQNKISSIKGVLTLTLCHSDYALLLDELRAIRTEKNKQSKHLTINKLTKWFPKKFQTTSKLSKSIFEYEDDKISKILNSSPNVVEQLSKNDINKIMELYPLLLNRFIKQKKVTNKIATLKSSKSATDKIVLNNLIEEFEQKLTNKSLSENAWQTFLQQHILLFNTAYVRVIEKTSVSLQGKYPDFMLVDMFNYVDIFEIKKPSTNLLKYDDSRNNYYWDTEMSKAIIQVENYISYLYANGPSFSQETRKIKGLNLSVMRPRGVIIAGSREQLKNEKMNDDFRLLKNSNSNIDFILFDDLLARLKNLAVRFE